MRTDMVELIALQHRTDFFETLVERFYVSLLRHGDVAIDAGANIGRHTIEMAKLVGPLGMVHAFEPAPRTVTQLRQKLTQHGWMPQVRVHELALSNFAGTEIFHFNPTKSGWSSLRSQEWRGPVDDIKLAVQVATLDGCLDDLPSWRLWKIDIEGAELHAIMGARELIRRHQPAIIFENGWHITAKVFGYSEAEFFEVFATLGYRLYGLYGNPISAWPHPGSGEPWYSIAVAAESADEVFVRDQWPAIVDTVIAETKAVHGAGISAGLGC